MLADVKSADFVITATALTGTIRSVAFFVTVGSAVTTLCIAYGSAPHIFTAMLTSFVITHPKVTHTALRVHILIAEFIVFATAGASVCKVAGGVIAYASVLTAIAAFNVRLCRKLITAGTVRLLTL